MSGSTGSLGPLEHIQDGLLTIGLRSCVLYRNDYLLAFFQVDGLQQPQDAVGVSGLNVSNHRTPPSLHQSYPFDHRRTNAIVKAHSSTKATIIIRRHL